MVDKTLPTLIETTAPADNSLFLVRRNGQTSDEKVTGANLKSYVLNAPTITGATIDNSVIGGTTPAAGTFTTLSATSLSLTTDLPITEGGTGASTAAAARTNLDAQQEISGATLTAATVATDDKVLIQDTSDSNNLKTVTAQSIADLSEVIDDTTPQLGGNLDVNGNSIVSASNGNIAITPNGTGSVVLDGLNWPQADGTSGQVIQTNGAGQLSFVTAGGGSSETVLTTGFRSSYYIPTLGHRRIFTNVNVTLVANTLYAMPYILTSSGTFDRIAIDVKTASSGHTLRLGIYEMTSGGIPGALVVDAGTVDVGTLGSKEVTISETLTANKGYFVAYVTDGTPGLSGAQFDQNVTNCFLGMEAPTDGGINLYTISHTFGALPDPYGTPTGFSDSTPSGVMLRSS